MHLLDISFPHVYILNCVLSIQCSPTNIWYTPMSDFDAVAVPRRCDARPMIVAVIATIISPIRHLRWIGRPVSSNVCYSIRSMSPPAVVAMS